MKEIDKELEEDEFGIIRMVGKGNGKKYTCAMVMMQITGKQVKALIDLGASEMLIARSWVEYLGLKKMKTKTSRYSTFSKESMESS